MSFLFEIFQNFFSKNFFNLKWIILFSTGTEDGDLDFECLSDFGPRFKKLADMYGDHSSESEEDDEQRQSGNESWC